MPRSPLIRGLLFVNAALAAALVWQNAPIPAARAQQAPVFGGASDRYLAVAGEMQNDYDAHYLLDTQERTLHVLIYDRGTRQFFRVASRDLDAEIRNNRPDDNPPGRR